MFIGFIIRLLKSENLYIKTIYNTIIIIINKLLKNAIFILLKKTYTVTQITNIKFVFAEHKLLKNLILNKNKLFISKF